MRMYARARPIIKYRDVRVVDYFRVLRSIRLRGVLTKPGAMGARKKKASSGAFRRRADENAEGLGKTRHFGRDCMVIGSSRREEAGRGSFR